MIELKNNADVFLRTPGIVDSIRNILDGSEQTVSKDSIEIEKFSVAARNELIRAGYLIYELTGQSLEGLIKNRTRGHLRVQNDTEGITEACISGGADLKESSRLSEVAFNPDPENFYIPGSGHLPLFVNGSRNGIVTASERINDYSELISRKIHDIAAVIGESADYIELASLHYYVTGGRELLFGKKYGLRQTWTDSGTDYTKIKVGVLRVKTLSFSDQYYSDAREGLWVAPLIIPVGE